MANITIDTISAGTDAYITSVFPTTNFNTTTINLASTSSGLVQFDLSSIPAGATIVSARYRMTTSAAGASQVINVYRLVREWVEAETTWNIAQTATNWGTAGANHTTTDYDNTLLGAMSFVAASNSQTIDITSTVSDWYTGAANNYGLKLAYASGGSRNYHSSEATVDEKPRLFVEYTYGHYSYEVNSTAITAGVQARWEPIVTGSKNDGNQRLNAKWQRHTWQARKMEMGTYETLYPLRGTALTELKTTGHATVSTGGTYSTANVMAVTGRQVGRWMENVVVTFLVDTTS